MADFYNDNDDIRFLIKHMDLGLLAEQIEEGFRFSEEFDNAPATKEEEEKKEEDATPLEVALSAPALFAPPKTQQGTGGTSQIRFAEEVLVPRPGRSRKGKKAKEKETDSKGKKAKRVKDTYLETEPEAEPEVEPEPVTEMETEPVPEPEMEPATGDESGEV